jgi:hypothetical protein
LVTRLLDGCEARERAVVIRPCPPLPSPHCAVGSNFQHHSLGSGGLTTPQIDTTTITRCLLPLRPPSWCHPPHVPRVLCARHSLMHSSSSFCTACVVHHRSRHHARDSSRVSLQMQTKRRCPESPVVAPKMGVELSPTSLLPGTDRFRSNET